MPASPQQRRQNVVLLRLARHAIASSAKVTSANGMPSSITACRSTGPFIIPAMPSISNTPPAAPGITLPGQMNSA